MHVYVFDFQDLFVSIVQPIAAFLLVNQDDPRSRTITVLITTIHDNRTKTINFKEKGNNKHSVFRKIIRDWT